MTLFIILPLLLVVYTFIGYYALVYLVSIARPRPVRKKSGGPWPKVSVVIAARNEGASIDRRLKNLIDQDYDMTRTEIVVVSDGSQDDTEAVVEKWVAESDASLKGQPRIRLISLLSSRGKAGAINAGVAAADGEVIVFADSRQRFSRTALKVMVESLADESVGCVSGELVLEKCGEHGAGSGIGAYWNFEKNLRKLESRIGSVPGATGAIYAIKKPLFRPIPSETILDDVLIPMRIAMQGFRVLFEGTAVAYDAVSPDMRHEMRRKIRTLAGNWQLLVIEPSLLNPFRNPLWVQFISHKVLRLLVPYTFLCAVAAAAIQYPVYIMSLAIGACLVASAAFICRRCAAINRFTGIVRAFLMLNYAALVAPFALIRGRKRLW